MGVEGFSEGLAQELAPFGIRVAIIEPGVTKSAIFAKNIDAPNSTGAYDAHYRRMFQFYAAGMAKPPIRSRWPDDPPGDHDRHPAPAVHRELVVGPRWRPCREGISDEDWVGLGAIADDDEYYRRSAEIFGVDIAPN